MKSLPLKGSIPIGGTQQEYNTIHGLYVPELGELRFIFELTPEEVAEIVRTHKLVYTQVTGGHLFQPMRIDVEWPGGEVPEILPDINKDPKQN